MEYLSIAVLLLYLTFLGILCYKIIYRVMNHENGVQVFNNLNKIWGLKFIINQYHKSFNSSNFFHYLFK